MSATPSGTTHLSAIRADSLREQVTRALEAALVAGELVPGEMYSAPVLAERFGVSATPVREAMLDLVSEGFVEPVRNRGYRVMAISDEDLDQIAQIRMLIEVPTIAQIAGRLTPEVIAALEETCRAIEGAAARHDLLGYLDNDRHFHVQLIATLGNPRLTDLVDRLRRQARLYGLQRLVETDSLASSASEHAELLAALRRGDVAGTEKLMAAHIGHTRGLWAGRDDHRVEDA